MSSTNFTVDTNKYIKVSDKDCVIQNLSPYPIRVIFGDTHPSKDDPNYHIVNPTSREKGSQEHILYKFNNNPLGNVYVRCGGSETFGRESEISVTYADTLVNPNNEILIELYKILSELKLLNARVEETFGTSITKNDLDC